MVSVLVMKIMKYTKIIKSILGEGDASRFGSMVQEILGILGSQN